MRGSRHSVSTLCDPNHEPHHCSASRHEVQIKRLLLEGCVVASTCRCTRNVVESAERPIPQVGKDVATDLNCRVEPVAFLEDLVTRLLWVLLMRIWYEGAAAAACLHEQLQPRSDRMAGLLLLLLFLLLSCYCHLPWFMISHDDGCDDEQHCCHGFSYQAWMARMRRVAAHACCSVSAS